MADLLNLVGELRGKVVGFRSLHEAIDTTTPGGRLVFHNFGAFAEFIRELIVERTREGLAAARALVGVLEYSIFSTRLLGRRTRLDGRSSVMSSGRSTNDHFSTHA